ncbi:mitochondrial 37S ribosomal protein uS5m [Aspergillus stella-maris]|uniref:mitochondrial 37S ribosomal protein uS5m n=1 Tax=Aspergillus stella-maris TaxID=1810926 RepID=UPI003CCD6503
MSFARSARCLFCSFSRAAATGSRVPRRQFQLSAAQFADKTDKGEKALTPVPQQVDGKTMKQLKDDMKPEHFKAYTEEEKAWLKNHYTPEQMAAIEAGEAAIDPKDMAEQFGVRRDPMSFKYLDDFAMIEPGVDKHVRAPETNSDYKAKLKTDDDFVEDFARFFANVPEDASLADWVRFIETSPVTKGKPENEFNANSSLVPDLFQNGDTLEGPRKNFRYFQDPDVLAAEKLKEEPSDAMKTLAKVTGYTQEELSTLRVRNLIVHLVSNQTRLGKIHSQYVLAIAGNGKGLLGIGEGKSEEIVDAGTQAKLRAIRNMKPVRRYENRTIFGDVTGKSGAVEVKLMSRPPGFGLRCQSLIYEMCRAAGIDDLAARVPGARNKMNVVKAVYQALMSQRDPEDVARARGKKIVDVRKVYYSGHEQPQPKPSKQQDDSKSKSKSRS